MYVTVPLGIKPGVPTKNGNVYTEQVCKKAVNQINKKTPIMGHYMEKMDLQPIGKPCFEVRGAELNDKGIELHIKTLDSKEGKILISEIYDGNIDILPIIEVGLHQPVNLDGVPTITEIKKVRGFGVSIKPQTRKPEDGHE